MCELLVLNLLQRIARHADRIRIAVHRQLRSTIAVDWSVFNVLQE
jgi:hypothetical protein